MGGVDIEHVRECIYELAGAYLHRLAALPLWSMSLLMRCSQDHFIFDALGGHRGGEIERVVDGLIGYCGMFSLTWMYKHKKEDLHGACGSFLFRWVCHTTMEDSSMDLVTILLPSHGKNFVVALIYFSTLYLYTLTISLQCIALQRGKFIFRLHGPFLASYYDGDNHILYDLGQVFGYFLYAHLIHLAIYYLLIDLVTYTTSHLSRKNLPCYYLKLQWGRLRCDHLGDCWYLPAPHKTFTISFIMMLIMVLFSDIILSFMRIMIG